MNFEKFKETVLDGIRKKADGMYKIRIKSVTKNNGFKLTGITAEAEGYSCAPCVYLDGFYEGYADGRTELPDTVDEIYGLLMKHLEEMRGIDVSGFLEWENVKGNIHAKLVNAEKNKELLENIPHRLFLDMAAVYYVAVAGLAAEGTGTYLIRNEHMEMWGQNEGNLYMTAISNMRADGRPCFDSMETVIKSIIPEDACFWRNMQQPPVVGMYILTNRNKCYGASEILDKSTLRTIADKIGDSFIVLPSSIHEVIILEPDDTAEYERLADMVKEVNTTQVDETERLSDHVYVYSRREEVLKVVA